MFKENEYEPGSLEGIREGIRWRERLDYGKTLAGFVSVWFVLQFVVQALENTIVATIFGCIYSLYFAIKAGGNEIYDGAEEFSFSLTPPRNERFKVKFLYCFLPLLYMQVMSLLCIKFNLPQYFWGLFVESGLSSPYIYGNKEHLFFYSIALLVPVCLYVSIFSATIISWGPGWLLGAAFKGFVITGAGAIAAAILYHNMGKGEATALTILLFIIITVICLNNSYKIYSFKEGYSVPRTSTSKTGGLWLIVIAAVIILFLLFISSAKQM